MNIVWAAAQRTWEVKPSAPDTLMATVAETRQKLCTKMNEHRQKIKKRDTKTQVGEHFSQKTI